MIQLFIFKWNKNHDIEMKMINCMWFLVPFRLINNFGVKFYAFFFYHRTRLTYSSQRNGKEILFFNHKKTVESYFKCSIAEKIKLWSNVWTGEASRNEKKKLCKTKRKEYLWLNEKMKNYLERNVSAFFWHTSICFMVVYISIDEKWIK